MPKTAGSFMPKSDSAKVIELVKGKSSIEMATVDDLVPTVELIKKAVEAGELDAQIEAAANKLREGFSK
jgi:hypothetical protein